MRNLPEYVEQALKTLKYFFQLIIIYGEKLVTKPKPLDSKNELVSWMLILILLISIVLFNLLSPSDAKFEAKLIVKQFSFINNEHNQLFLGSIQKIPQITIGKKILGKNNDNDLTLVGEFKDLTNTQQSLINQSKRLHIKFNGSGSQLIINANNSPKNSELTIQSLRLGQDTKIKDLDYNSYKNTLNFSLKPGNSSAEFSELQLNLGRTKVKVTLTGEYELTNELQQTIVKSSSRKYREATFSFKPDISDLAWILPSNNDLVINLPEKNNESQKWFNRQIEVKNVEFKSQDQGGSSVRDEFPVSHIIRGKIRMSEQNLDIDEEQFLIIEQSAIKQLRNLKLLTSRISQDSGLSTNDQVPNSLPELTGIDVGISGKSKKIEIGISPDFPVASIRGNRWTKHLSQDAITAIISFSSAMMIALITGLINIWRS